MRVLEKVPSFHQSFSKLFGPLQSAHNLFHTMAPFWFLHSTSDLCVRCWKLCGSEEAYPCKCNVTVRVPYPTRLRATWGYFNTPVHDQRVPFWFLHSTSDLCVRCWKLCDTEEAYPCRCNVTIRVPYTSRLRATWGYFDTPVHAQRVELPAKPMCKHAPSTALILHNPAPIRGTIKVDNFFNLPEIEV